MKRFGDKDKKATEECYAEVAEKFTKTSGKSNRARNNYYLPVSLYEFLTLFF